jgi:hypothetical protein
MAPRDRNELHVPIDARLAQLAAASPTSPPWYEAWARLGGGSTPEERLEVYRAIRAAGSLPAEAALYLIAWHVQYLALDRPSDAVRRLQPEIEAVRRDHGLREDECWFAGEAPPAFFKAERRLRKAEDAHYADLLERLGEHDLARLFRQDRAPFERLCETGERYFEALPTGEATDERTWLQRLLAAVKGCIEAESVTGPVGLRCRRGQGAYEVAVYLTAVEIVGGPHDGAGVAPVFCLDLERLRQALTSVTACRWNALGAGVAPGPHVHISGVFQGRNVELHSLGQEPADEKPGRKVQATARPRRSR